MFDPYIVTELHLVGTSLRVCTAYKEAKQFEIYESVADCIDLDHHVLEKACMSDEVQHFNTPVDE